MFKAIKTLFSSDKLIDNITSGVDKMVLTTEEKLDNFKELLQLYAPFKIAQRFCMLIFCIPYAICWTITFIAGFWIKNEPMLKTLDGDMGTIVITIVVFYFGGGALEGAVTRFKGLKDKVVSK